MVKYLQNFGTISHYSKVSLSFRGLLCLYCWIVVLRKQLEQSVT